QSLDFLSGRSRKEEAKCRKPKATVTKIDNYPQIEDAENLVRSRWFSFLDMASRF
ncbi:11294_t:CDS:1, partial [Funneliformis geosporum]